MGNYLSKTAKCLGGNSANELIGVAQKIFNSSGSYSFAEFIVLWPFNVQNYFICTSIRNWIAHAEENIVNKDSPIKRNWRNETLWILISILLVVYLRAKTKIYFKHARIDSSQVSCIFICGFKLVSLSSKRARAKRSARKLEWAKIRRSRGWWGDPPTLNHPNASSSFCSRSNLHAARKPKKIFVRQRLLL